MHRWARLSAKRAAACPCSPFVGDTGHYNRLAGCTCSVRPSGPRASCCELNDNELRPTCATVAYMCPAASVQRQLAHAPTDNCNHAPYTDNGSRFFAEIFIAAGIA